MSTSEQIEEDRMTDKDTNRKTNDNTDSAIKSAKLFTTDSVLGRASAKHRSVSLAIGRRPRGPRPGRAERWQGEGGYDNRRQSTTAAVISNIPIKCSLYYAPGQTTAAEATHRWGQFATDEDSGARPGPRCLADRPTERETDGPREAAQAKDADNESRDQHITSAITTTANARGAKDSSTRDWLAEGDDGTGLGKILPVRLICIRRFWV